MALWLKKVRETEVGFLGEWAGKLGNEGKFGSGGMGEIRMVF